MAQRVNRGLRGTPMAGLGWELEAAGWQFHVSPALMAAIAGTESGFGVAACGNDPRNAYGLASCNQSWSVPYFRTWHESIWYFARFLRSHWPHARSAYELYGYAACNSCWSSKVAYYMRARFGLGPFVRYP